MTLQTALNDDGGEPQRAILIALLTEREPGMGAADAGGLVRRAQELANQRAAKGTPGSRELRECLEEELAIFRLTAVRLADAGKMVRRCERRLGHTDASELVDQAYLKALEAVRTGRYRHLAPSEWRPLLWGILGSVCIDRWRHLHGRTSDRASITVNGQTLTIGDQLIWMGTGYELESILPARDGIHLFIRDADRLLRVGPLETLNLLPREYVISGEPISLHDLCGREVVIVALGGCIKKPEARNRICVCRYVATEPLRDTNRYGESTAGNSHSQTRSAGSAFVRLEFADGFVIKPLNELTFYSVAAVHVGALPPVLDRYARDTWCIPSAWPVSAIQRLPAGRGLIEVPGDVGDYSDRGRTVGATEARIDMKRLESAVAEQLASKLTPQQWKIMYLSSACGWSDQEIASDLNLPRATIARTLREVERIFRELDGE